LCFIIENSRRPAPRFTAGEFFARPFQKIGGGGAINYPGRSHGLPTAISSLVQVNSTLAMCRPRVPHLQKKLAKNKVLAKRVKKK
jgi:hypothetical protein